MQDLAAFIDPLIAAHRDRSAFSPGPVRPTTLAQAHAVHEAMVEALGPIGGFKITRAPDTTPVVVPIPSSRCAPSHARVEVPAAVLLEIEVGFIVIDALPDPADPDFRRKLLAAVRPAPMVELVGSRILGPLADDPMVKLADLQACEALVFGDPVADWRGSDIAHLAARVSAGDQLSFEGEGAVPNGSAIAALETAAKALGTHLGGFQVGHKLLTGSLLPPRSIDPGCTIHADLAGLGQVAVSI